MLSLLLTAGGAWKSSAHSSALHAWPQLLRGTLTSSHLQDAVHGPEEEGLLGGIGCGSYGDRHMPFRNLCR